MAVYCEKCGARVSSRAALPGHYRRAHGGQARHPAALAPANPRLIDVAPVRWEIVPTTRPVAPVRPAPPDTRIVPARPKPKLAGILSGEKPPSWWEPQAEEGWRREIWAGFPADYRNRLFAQRAGAAFSIRPPEATDEVILWSQYHALKAIATRLDAGIGTERERVAFEAGLREYNANYDRIRAQRKALPG